MKTTPGYMPCPSATAPKILVVDDSQCIRELLCMHLGNAGYEVLAAEDAIEAGRLLLEHSPHLLIADVMMPYMSGTEFVGALRADPRFVDLPVIFLTSKENLGPDAAKLRAVAHLIKPVTVKRLLEVIELHVPCSDGALKRKRCSRVVVVEDNPDAAESLYRLLELCGYKVTLAKTGKEALRAIREICPSAVLCDISLPDMDGYALAAKVRADAVTADMKMIAVTAFGSEDDRRRSREVGFDTHLVKPVEPGVLLRHLESAG